DAAQAVALTCFAAPALHVEAEAAWPVTAFARFGQHREKLANRRKNSAVGRGVRTWRAANRRLIDLDNFVDVFDAQNFAVRARRLHRAIKLLRQCAVEDIVYQRRFAGPVNSGHYRQQTEWNGYDYI